jgi:hypothetical protein
LPVVFDDFRESGIRADIVLAVADHGVRQILEKSRFGQELIAETNVVSAKDGDFAGIASTFQERSERVLAGWLERSWSLWAARTEARGQISVFLHNLRNTVLGISPTSKRRMIVGRFSKNWAALQAIISLAESEEIKVIVYVPPLRRDVAIPYDEGQYAEFKRRLSAEFDQRNGVIVADLEAMVENSLWGTKQATTIGGEPEYDFMHFRGEGHRALADAMFKLVDRYIRGKP